MTDQMKKEMDERLIDLWASGFFEGVLEQVFVLRYGLEDHPKSAKDISKALKIPARRVKQYIERVERAVFNQLKKDVYTPLDADSEEGEQRI